MHARSQHVAQSSGWRTIRQAVTRGAEVIGGRSTRPRRGAELAAVYGMLIVPVTAQNPRPDADASPTLVPANEYLSPTPAKVDVNPVARDEGIRQRLQGVLDATDWFIAPDVRGEEADVFLQGCGASHELKKWAGYLARNNQDVVAP